MFSILHARFLSAKLFSLVYRKRMESIVVKSFYCVSLKIRIDNFDENPTSMQQNIIRVTFLLLRCLSNRGSFENVSVSNNIIR